MHVIFVEPGFPDNQREFVRALVQVGASVTGIGERDEHQLDPDLRSWLSGYWKIGSVTDEGGLEWAVRSIQEQGWVDRLEATVEAHILPTAHVRERCTIPGTTARTAWLCRDKPSMKEVLAEAGVPTAQSLGSGSVEEIQEFAARVGYPLIVKPRDGAGAAGTSRVDDETELLAALAASGVGADGHPGASVAIEEFIEGHEGFWDTLTVNGEVVHEFISHYYPGVLEAMRSRWISPQIVATNQVDDPRYDEVREMGRRVLDVLDIETSATHMEWFFGPKGLKFSEIGCRPPGVSMWDVYAAANDLDLYREWAQLIAHGHTDQQASRRFAAGMIALRPSQDGHIAEYSGLEGLQAEFGGNIFSSHFPPIGSPTQGVDAGYKANAWVRARHEDYDHLRFILDEIGRRAKVIAR